MTEEVEIVLRAILYDDITYEYDLYKENLLNDIIELESFTLSFMLDKCLFYKISPIFIYLLSPKLKPKSLEMIFEIAILFKYKLITKEDFISYFDLIYSGKKSLSEVCKMILQGLKFVFTPKSMKKNALFAYKEFLYKFNPLPMLDSGSLLTKEPQSLKIQPSTLIAYDYNITFITAKLCLNALKNSSSRMVIFSTLNKILFLYNCDIKVKNMVSELDYNSLTLDDFYKLLDDVLLELDKDLLPIAWTN